MKCGRCGSVVEDITWYCWWCGLPLCSKCGDEVGHCGHPEADAVNQKTGRARSWEERHSMLMRERKKPS